MNAELTEIARRFVACPGWVFLPGMLARLDGALSPVTCRVVEVVGRDSCFGVSDGAAPRGFVSYYLGSSIPDLDDPVTAAGILPVVRRAWGRDMWVREDEEGGYICEALCKSPALMSIERFGVGPSEILALLAALEAAPK